MITDYDEFKRLLKESYPNTTEGVDGVLFLTMDSISISIVPVPSDPGAVMFRLQVLELKDIGRPGKFAKAAVIDYLSKPENIEKIFNFIEKNAGYAFNKIMKIVEWVAIHPEVALAVAEQAVAMFKGATSLIESETTRTVRFNYINGEMESVSISSDKNSSFGVNVDPLGVGLGVGFDVKYTVSESLNDRGILVKPTLNVSGASDQIKNAKQILQGLAKN